MNALRMLAWCVVLLGTAFTPVSGSKGNVEGDASVLLNPDAIEIGLFYHGSEVQVTAEVTSCDGAVLVLEAGAEEVTFSRKGKKAGIWLSLAQVTISGVPTVYLMGSSRELDAICSVEVQRKLGLGLASLRERMRVQSEKPLVGSEAEEFLKLKTESGTYSTDVPVELAAESEGQQRLSARFPISATVPPGDYNVAVYCFADGQLVQKGMGGLVIQRVGLANLLASLAYDRAALYGIIAILIAMVVGILMGMIFHSRPGSGH